MHVETPFLYNTWYCAGWSTQVTREPFRRFIVGEPILMFRTVEGPIAALRDVCPHRFAPLHKGRLDGNIIICPYHGLAYDQTGVCVKNPHGNGVIPANARVRTYRVVERQGAVWIWMGSKTPDETAIVDLDIVNNDHTRMLTGHLQMPIDYRLLVDNLLDLLHVPYLHRNAFAGSETRKAEFTRDGNYARMMYTDENILPPASQKLFFDAERGDYRSYIDWNVPGIMRNATMMSEVGEDPLSGSIIKGGHIITPATHTESHYFWYSTRNRCTDDRNLDEKLRSLLNYLFAQEDGPMLIDCQANMGGHGDLVRLRPISLQSDAAGWHARTVMARLIANEQEKSS